MTPFASCLAPCETRRCECICSCTNTDLTHTLSLVVSVPPPTGKHPCSPHDRLPMLACVQQEKTISLHLCLASAPPCASLLHASKYVTPAAPATDTLLPPVAAYLSPLRRNPAQASWKQGGRVRQHTCSLPSICPWRAYNVDIPVLQPLSPPPLSSLLHLL